MVRSSRDEDGGAGFLGMQQIGLPVSALAAGLDVGGPQIDRDAVLDVLDGPMPAAPPAAPALGTRQVMAPLVAFGAPDLGIDEPIDALMADPHARVLQRQPAGDLFGRPSHCKAVQHELAQGRLAFHPAAAPAPGPGLGVGIGRLVAYLRSRVPIQLARDRRCRAIQTRSDLPDRVPVRS